MPPRGKSQRNQLGVLRLRRTIRKANRSAPLRITGLSQDACELRRSSSSSLLLTSTEKSNLGSGPKSGGSFRHVLELLKTLQPISCHHPPCLAGPILPSLASVFEPRRSQTQLIRT